MAFNTLTEVQEQLREGKLTCSALVEEHLKRIEENQHLNAFLEVFAHDARSRATVIDQKIKRGSSGKLAGMIIGIKDNICFKGHKVSASSRILEDFTSLYSSTVVDRLLNEDAIIIGRLNCDEFAMGSANEFSAFGPVKNPLDNTKVTGGSSGGSAAAVAAGLCHVALGSDTGGSIRQPASFCGVVGLKPTYGRVSRHGLIAFASSFDQIGPFATSVEDAALIYEVMAGADEYDSTASQREVEKTDFSATSDKPMRIAFLKDALTDPSLDAEIRERTQELISQLQEKGHTVEGVSFPWMDYMVPVYYILTTAEASSNLARYDGIHYGQRSEKATDLESTYKLSRTEGFGDEVKRRILLGTFVLSSGYYDAYYGKAQKARRVVKEETEKILADYDLILSPTSPHTAFELGKKQLDPTVMYLEDIFTVQANICGNPAVSLPLGKHSNGMPFGIHLMGRAWDEKTLLEFSAQLMNNN
ncbi:MAG TPA: Asp-tRNA(Asn)/Glu-tRNA(Gln) amidotransferase GatCAB subunit A [Cryomorphaceae bacterium]|nr:Asp-tRNA(Asn)/Glu-tRNA(Gln) amidotransferase GatCAB subunit A [Owenweeksia sp.]MBF99164.1 Asp-tRNA(Asn)/Glu-tRNA(Gln) amidotransferase GatCAB subunit A [Owenweeksia sp.]HAD96116.1 Asp-tRNA(Asn)/Glu-tRNA(Gln) amidotransferase GatCAB subunit A [Cryomorphaceae bacterium]HCQ16769.1 Asp-tRNA(Asn)/Glu-tRNA(Gln) amidotransferase GatCAB subunit A [Cryomorphaceae bacterium]|tara:strand:- start:31712 stop:33133 length:1422 start_codon:yes stop_codon:yes gene_type:complete